MASRSARGIIIAVAAVVVLVIVGVVTWLLVRSEKTDRPAATTSPAASKGTEVITAVAVDAAGHPANGYQRVPDPQDPGGVVRVSGCSASPAAVAGDIYTCAPTAAGADVCWPSTPGFLLCLNDPWAKQLHRVTSANPLPQVQPTAAPAPFALLLDDGTQCRLRNGGAWGARDDGLVGAYGCRTANLVVLVPQSARSTSVAIDKSQPLWTVKVGSLGGGDDIHMPPPQTHTVTTAWFAGTAGPA